MNANDITSKPKLSKEQEDAGLMFNIVKKYNEPEFSQEQKDMKRMYSIIKKYKAYVRHYNNTGNENFNMDKTFILDMIYGIGIAVDPDKYSFSVGFDEFKKHLIEEILKDKTT